MAIAALRMVHRGRVKALSSRSTRRVTAHLNTKTPDARPALPANSYYKRGLSEDFEETDMHIAGP
jgi:hypothetical protein